MNKKLTRRNTNVWSLGESSSSKFVVFGIGGNGFEGGYASTGGGGNGRFGAWLGLVSVMLDQMSIIINDILIN